MNNKHSHDLINVWKFVNEVSFVLAQPVSASVGKGIAQSIVIVAWQRVPKSRSSLRTQVDICERIWYIYILYQYWQLSQASLFCLYEHV